MQLFFTMILCCDIKENLKRKTKSLLFFRLQNPYECPFNGSRRQDCACRNDYLAAGFTVFRKIRFDVASMQIKSKHFVSFSQFEHSIEIVHGHNY